MEKKKKSQGGVKTLNSFRLTTNKTRNASSIGLNSISEKRRGGQSRLFAPRAVRTN